MLLSCSQPAPPAAPEPAPAPAPAPAPLCELRAQVTDGEEPVGGVGFVVTVRERLDERRWRTLDRLEGAADVGGRITVSVPCGAELSLDLRGWVWSNPVPDLRVSEGGLDLPVLAYGKIEAVLFAADPTGRLAGRFVRARDGRSLELPLEGLTMVGLEMAAVAGTVEVPGHPPRAWRPDRSDVWEEHEPGHGEASLFFGDLAARWLVPSPALRDQVRGAWCLQGGQRAEACQHRPSGWRCRCSERVALASDRWDTAWVLELTEIETVLDALPEPVEVCGEPARQLRPAGVDGGSLFQAMLPPGKPCARVPAGQATEVGGPGAWAPIAVPGSAL